MLGWRPRLRTGGPRKDVLPAGCSGIAAILAGPTAANAASCLVKCKLPCSNLPTCMSLPMRMADTQQAMP